MTVVPVQAFDGVLDRMKHGRLVLDIDNFANRAGIAPECIWTSAKTAPAISNDDLSYLQKCLVLAREKHIPGLVYTGTSDVTEKFSLMCGALVRAFVDARLMTMMEVVDLVTKGEQPEATVLFVPNFYATNDFGKFDMRKSSALGDMLVHRAAHHLPTVLKVDTMKDLHEKFGSHVKGIFEKMVHQGV